MAGFAMQNIVSIEEPYNPAQLNLIIYPNPTENGFWISGNINSNETIKVELIDMIGRSVYQETLPACSELNHRVNTSFYANSVYLIKVSTGTSSFTQRVIIQK